MNEPIVYADGYGRWHAYVPESIGTGYIPVRYASQFIEAELSARGAGITSFSRYVMENIRLSDTQDKPGMIHFVEYELETEVA